MITLRKLSTLAPGTRERKTHALIREFEHALASGTSIDADYLSRLLRFVQNDDAWPEAVRSAAGFTRGRGLSAESGPSGGIEWRTGLNRLGHEMGRALGRDWADWDAAAPFDGTLDEYRPLAPFRIYLDGIRSPFNVGSILRTAMAFGMEQVWISPDTASPEHRRSRRSAMGAADRVPWRLLEPEQLTAETAGTLFALELGGTDISEYPFPATGTVVLGSEELGVSPVLLEQAREDGGVVTIPLPGPKASLNVGVAFGILAERWWAARGRGGGPAAGGG